MTLGERLYQYRKNVNLSQDTLAEKVGVTRQTISKWETDQSTPEFSKIAILCETFGITPNELVYGETGEVKESGNLAEIEEKKRNKKKAFVVSVSIFLYCMGAFSIPYMVESLQYDDSKFHLGDCQSSLNLFFPSKPKKENQESGNPRANRRKENKIKQSGNGNFRVSRCYFPMYLFNY